MKGAHTQRITAACGAGPQDTYRRVAGSPLCAAASSFENRHPRLPGCFYRFHPSSQRGGAAVCTSCQVHTSVFVCSQLELSWGNYRNCARTCSCDDCSTYHMHMTGRLDGSALAQFCDGRRGQGRSRRRSHRCDSRLHKQIQQQQVKPKAYIRQLSCYYCCGASPSAGAAAPAAPSAAVSIAWSDPPAAAAAPSAAAPGAAAAAAASDGGADAGGAAAAAGGAPDFITSCWFDAEHAWVTR